MSDTIWNGTTPTYRTVLDQVDPEVAKMLGGSPPSTVLGAPSAYGPSEFSGDFSGDFTAGRRFSLNEQDGIFSLGKVRPTAYAASTGHKPLGGAGGAGNGGGAINFGTASISGGIASRHPPKDSFLLKFALVADATRDLERDGGTGPVGGSVGGSVGGVGGPVGGSGLGLSENIASLGDGLGLLSLDSRRRLSFNNSDIIISPHGSLNENLNHRGLRHQSISEKIDNYNNNLPIQAHAEIAGAGVPGGAGVAGVAGGPVNGANNGNGTSPAAVGGGAGPGFWNPATAASFTPAGFGFMEPFAGPGAFAYRAPPFVLPPPAFADLYYEKDDDPPLHGALRAHTPGIGMMKFPPSAGMIFPGFNPYAAPGSVSTSGSPAPPPPPAQVTAQAPPVGPSAVPATGPGAPDKTETTPPPRPRKRNAPKAPASHIYRLPLLEEVRSNFKGKEYYLKDIYGHAVEFTKDQHGSRFIQQKLPSASDEEKEVIFNEIRDISYDLMTDVFGNYVIQKFFEFGSTTQQQVLLDYMIGHIYDLSLQMYGCRVVQRALEAIDLDGQILIIDELKDHILVCAKDQNGNHVIQKSIERIPFERIRFVLDSLDNQIYHLSTHPYGCRVIQRLLEHSTVDDQRKILGELNRFIFYLIQDQYGNYVMQHILERGNADDREEILMIVLGSVVNFSKHKFASNVIEKCIKYGTLEQRKRILREVLVGNEDEAVELVSDDSALALMVKDQYANYVIQKLVEGFDAKSVEKKKLVSKLRQYLKQISSKNTYGKHLASVEKMIIVAENALVEAERSG